MNEPPGPTTALGIEAVQWLAQGGESLTVRVSGRWRRRRPTWSGQPLLVVETETIRERFPAMPEPPGMSGTVPGTWQLSFSVPAALPRRPGARVWLQLGSTVVPLSVPDAVEGPARPRVPEPASADAQTLAARRVRAAELASEAAVRRAVQAEVRIEELSDEVSQAKRELALAEERALAARTRERAAEQQAHAEHELGEELAGQLDRLESDGAAAQARIEELQAQVQVLQRGLDEAEHALGAARAARLRAERELGSLATGRLPGRPDDMRRESELLRRGAVKPLKRGSGELAGALGSGRRRAPGSVLPGLGDERRLQAERQLHPPLTRPARSGSPEAPAGLADAAGDGLGEILAALRSELDAVAGLAEHERRARLAAERRLGWAQSGLAGLRIEFERLRAEVGGVDRVATAIEPPGPERRSEPDPGTTHASPEAQRLSAALARLRAQTPPLEEPPANQDWLLDALIALARQDRECATVSIARLTPTAEADRAARWLAATGSGRWSRRRLRRRLRREPDLARRLEHPGRFAAVGLQAPEALALAGAMVAPEWTTGERFAIAHGEGPCLLFRDGRQPGLGLQPEQDMKTIRIECPPEQLPAVLSGRRPAGTVLSGPVGQLELLEHWLERAQSG